MSIFLFILGALAVVAGSFSIHPGAALVVLGLGLLRASAVTRRSPT